MNVIAFIYFHLLEIIVKEYHNFPDSSSSFEYQNICFKVIILKYFKYSNYYETLYNLTENPVNDSKHEFEHLLSGNRGKLKYPLFLFLKQITDLQVRIH